MAKKLEVINEIVPKGNFPVVSSENVQAGGKRLDKALADIETEQAALSARMESLKNIYKVFNDVSEMKDDTTLKVGDNILTQGYYSLNDGGSAFYKIVETGENNDFTVIGLNNGKFAELKSIEQEGYIDVRWAGAHNTNENVDSSGAFKKAIEYSNEHFITPIRIVGDYYISSTVNVIGSLCLRGEHISSSRQFVGKANLPESEKAAISKIRIAPNITAFDIVGLGSTSDEGAKATSLDIRNIEFTGSNTSIIMDVHAYGAPSRPSIVENCEVYGIDTFFKSIWNSEHSNGTLIYNFDFRNNNVYNCVKLFDVKGKNNTVPTLGGLNIHDNVIEQGVGMSILNMFGCNYIINNLFEGTSRDFDFTINRGSLDFSGNYFESNSNKISIKSSGSIADVFISSMYTYNCPNMSFDLFNVNLISSVNLINPKFDAVNIMTPALERIKDNLQFNHVTGTYGVWFGNVNEEKNPKESVKLTSSSMIKEVNDRIVFYSENRMTFGLNGAPSVSVSGISGDLINISFWKQLGAIESISMFRNSDGATTGLSLSNVCPKSGYYSITFRLDKDMPSGGLYVKIPCGISNIMFANLTKSNKENAKVLETISIANSPLTFGYSVSQYGLTIDYIPTVESVTDEIILKGGTAEEIDGYHVYKSASSRIFGVNGGYSDKVNGKKDDYINLSFWKPSGNVDVSLLDNSSGGGYGLSANSVWQSEGFHSVTFKLTKDLPSGGLYIKAPNGIGNITFKNVTLLMKDKITDNTVILK